MHAITVSVRADADDSNSYSKKWACVFGRLTVLYSIAMRYGNCTVKEPLLIPSALSTYVYQRQARLERVGGRGLEREESTRFRLMLLLNGFFNSISPTF